MRSRCTDADALPVTIRPPFAERAKAANARSISPASRTLTGLASYSEQLRRTLENAELSDAGRIGGISKDPHPFYEGRDLFEEFQPFPARTIFEQHKAGNVAARPG